MKRFHVHVSVPDLAAGIDFYSVLFGQSPSVQKPDYAKWMLDDPRVNFAISARGRGVGVNHLGLQTDSDAELEVLNAQLQEADLKTHREKNVSCCYARSNKYWVTDPAGVAWETFHSLGAVPTYDGHNEVVPAMAACCDDSSAAAATATSCGAKAACCS